MGAVILLRPTWAVMWSGSVDPSSGDIGSLIAETIDLCLAQVLLILADELIWWIDSRGYRSRLFPTELAVLILPH